MGGGDGLDAIGGHLRGAGVGGPVGDGVEDLIQSAARRGCGDRTTSPTCEQVGAGEVVALAAQRELVMPREAGTAGEGEVVGRREVPLPSGDMRNAKFLT